MEAWLDTSGVPVRRTAPAKKLSDRPLHALSPYERQHDAPSNAIRRGTRSARPGLRTVACGRAREVREDTAAGAASSRCVCERRHSRSTSLSLRRADRAHTAHSQLEEETRELLDARLRALSAIAAMAKSAPLLTATEQAEAACSSCKAGNCPRKTDGCGDFLRISHPDYAGQRSPLEYCVSEFR